MYNWSTDEKELKKTPERHAIWRIEQMVNFGLGNEKISQKELECYWSKLALDPDRKKYLAFLIGHDGERTL